MATNFNTGPYFDDFDPAKNFYRVLFKPGYAVQARELNQLQSILQNQVTSVGNHLFKKNSIIIPGGIALNRAADIISVTNINDPSALVGKTITNATSFDQTDDTTLDGYITAVVLGYRAAVDTTPAALYVKYFKTQTDGRGTFNASEELRSVDTSLITFNVDDTIGATVGKVVSLSKGTFFTKEIFVEAPQQFLILETDNFTITNCIVGLNIIESIITSDDDESLLDNANGSPNQYAPGADRYKIELVLTRVDATTTVNDDVFITMMKMENDVITYLNNKTEYAELMKTLARRTYDANGNFIVRGLDTSIIPAVDDEYVWANIGRGKCYLGGYEYEQLQNTNIAIEKPRAAQYQQEMNPTAKYSNGMAFFYTAGSSYMKEIPEADSLVQFLNTSIVNLVFNATSGSVVDTTAGTITVTSHKLVTGNAVIYSSNGGTAIGGLASGTTYYIIRITANSFKLATSLANATAGTAINLATGATGTTHNIQKVTTVVGYGVFKSIQFAFGTIGTNDVYKMFFDYVSMEKGYAFDDIGAVKAITLPEGAPVLHELNLTNIIGNFTAGNTIKSATDDTQSGLLYNVVNTYAYVIKDSLDEIPNTPTVKDTTTNATATLEDTFITNYRNTFYPMIEVDADVVKTLYNKNDINTTSYSVIRRDVFNVSIAGTYETSFTLGANDTFEDYSTSDYFAFIATAGSESFVDLTNILSITAAGKKYHLTIPSGHAMLGKTVRVYSTVNKTNVGESAKTAVLYTAAIPNPSSSWTALPHQDVKEIIKVVDSPTVTISTASWTSSVATITTITSHGLSVGNTIVIKGIQSSANTAGNYNSGYNAVFAVNAVTSNTIFTVVLVANPGTYISSNGVVAVPPDINTHTDITSRFVLDTGNTAYSSGTGLIKLKKGAVAPQGQVAIQYRYFTADVGNYISVDSYGSYSGDLSYIGDIANIFDANKNEIETRRYIDFRTRTSNYFFKNIGTIQAGTTTLALRDLNLSGAASLIGKYVVGPSHLTGVTITGVSFNSVTGNTELTLNSPASGLFSGTYYIGLNGSSLSLIDSTAGGKSFSLPKDSTRFSYQHVKFLSRQVLIYIDRQSDVLKVDFKDVLSQREADSLRRNEFKLPLAHVYMKPYTVNMRDVVVTKYENPVYQMLDIHELKKRIDRNEYYSSLALSELSSTQNIVGQSLLGFWNEDFMNPSQQDYDSDDFACTIYDRSYAAPGTVTRTVNLQLDTSLNTATWTQTGSAITLPYTEVRAFGNNKASRFNNLNPFNAINWNGSLKLNPSVDNWVDVTAPVTINTNTVNTTVRPVEPTISTPPPIVNPTPPSVESVTTVPTVVKPPVGTVVTPPPIVNPTPPPVVTIPPSIVPAPIVDEFITNVRWQISQSTVTTSNRTVITNAKPTSQTSTAIKDVVVVFSWETNIGRTGQVNSTYSLSPILAQFPTTHIKNLLRHKYNEVGVKEYLNAGTPLDHPIYSVVLGTQLSQGTASSAHPLG